MKGVSNKTRKTKQIQKRMMDAETTITAIHKSEQPKESAKFVPNKTPNEVKWVVCAEWMKVLLELDGGDSDWFWRQE